MKKLTREQAAFIGAFTGISMGPFEDVHGLIEVTLGRPVYTHEMADPSLWKDVCDALRPHLWEIAATIEEN